jgi:hypothetical protein
MELKKTWNDGGSLTATYEGSGDGSAVFSSDPYEGIDRVQSVVFRDAEKTVAIEKLVRQEGIRQAIGLYGGGVFRLANGGRFGVLKGAEVKPDYSTYRGVYIQSVDGWLYSATEWDGSKEANGIAIQTDNVSIVLALEDAYSGYCVWGTRSNIAGVNNSDSKATVRTYFNGEAETDAIINNAANSTAATHCKNFIFPNGQHGYMGAGGEWWTVLTYKNDIITAMTSCGGTTPSKDYWCTTEQVGSNRAWAADWEGSYLTNYNKTDSSSVRVRAFCKLIY